MPFKLDIVPDRTLEFVPREQELRELECCLLPIAYGPDQQKTFILHGTGGMGKTRLAVHFAELHQQDFDSIFFLDGKSLTTLKQSFARVLRRITKQAHNGPPEATVNSDDSEAASKALEWFCLPGNTRWLLIFDNVDTEASEQDKSSYHIVGYFPGASWGSVLVTTRLTNLASLGQEKRVNKMDEIQARQLLANVLHISSSRYHNFTAAQISVEPGTKGMQPVCPNLA